MVRARSGGRTNKGPTVMTATRHRPPAGTYRLRILGDVGAADFRAWTLRHAARLGLGCAIIAHRADCLELTATGPGDLVEALALGCSLGPRSVMVDRVETAAEAREIPFPDA
jgi:acylphosphatase